MESEKNVLKPLQKKLEIEQIKKELEPMDFTQLSNLLGGKIDGNKKETAKGHCFGLGCSCDDA